MDVQKEISLRNAISYCIENNDVNTATNRIMELIRDEEEILKDDDDNQFESVEKADYLAEGYYKDTVLISTKDGIKKCKGERCNAWQPDGQYNYFFTEVKP